MKDTAFYLTFLFYFVVTTLTLVATVLSILLGYNSHRLAKNSRDKIFVFIVNISALFLLYLALGSESLWVKVSVIPVGYALGQTNSALENLKSVNLLRRLQSAVMALLTKVDTIWMLIGVGIVLVAFGIAARICIFAELK